MSPISNASRLADFGSGIGTQGAVIQVDNTNKRVGIGTTNPQAMLQVGTAISMFGLTGIVSATTFYGSGEGLTGVASTDNIITGTAATFNSQLNVGSNIKMGPAGVITATSFSGDGSNLEGISAGLGTALSDDATNPLNLIFKTPVILYVGATGTGVTINVTSDVTSGNLAFMRQKDIHIAAGSTMTIGAGTTLVQNVLSIF